MKLSSTVKSKVKKNALDRLKTLKIEKRTNLHICNDVLVAGEVLKAANFKVTLSRDTAFVLVDLAPMCNWAHPCEYHLYDADTGKLYQKVPAALPPSKLEPKAITVFHYPVKRTDKRVVVWDRHIIDITHVFQFLPKRYAILFAGKAENRHTNDLEFLYRTLIDVYGFDANNIQVLNHDGTVNYFLGPSGTGTIGASLGNWPGDNTAYRMVVNGEGTRAGFQAAINAIAAKIKSNDFLFIHTNNHGGGPCDSGVNDYCMFVYNVNGNWVPYYVNDFVTDLSALPQFKTLMVMMEQCRSGGFITPIINNSPATRTHVATAVSENDYSLGGANFDPFAEDWIAGLRGSYADGSGLSLIVDTNVDGYVSAAEVFNYANSVRSYNGTIVGHCPSPNGTPLRYGDTPISTDSPTGCGNSILL